MAVTAWNKAGAYGRFGANLGLAGLLIHANPKGFESNVIDPFKNGTKTDDLADSLLLVCYYLETYSNQLSVTPFSIPEEDGI